MGIYAYNTSVQLNQVIFHYLEKNASYIVCRFRNFLFHVAVTINTEFISNVATQGNVPG